MIFAPFCGILCVTIAAQGSGARFRMVESRPCVSGVIENRSSKKRRSLPLAKRNKEPKLKIIPLGGLGEIGKNMTVYEYQNDIIVVDIGSIFPREDMPGVDLVIPDTTYLEKNQRSPARIFHHPWPRGSHRRGALCAAQDSRTGLRHQADAGAVREQAQGAPPDGRRAAERGRGGRRDYRRRVQGGVHPRQPFHRGRVSRWPSTRRWAPSFTPATSRLTSRPRTARRSNFGRFAELGTQGRAGAAGRQHQRGAPGLYDERAARSPRRSIRCSSAPRAASSSPCSPATSRAFSRWWIRPCASAARSVSWAAAWSTWPRSPCSWDI